MKSGTRIGGKDAAGDFLRRPFEMTTLPKPKCHLGYTELQLHEMLGDRYEEFGRWMHGQTMAICDGRIYDHAAQQYLPYNCGPHGSIVYPQDVEQFLRGGGPLD